MTTTASDPSPLDGQAVAAALLLLALAGLSVYVFCRTPTEPPATFVAVVLDVSPTARPDDLCRDALGIAWQALEDSRGPVELTLYETGDSTTGDEPLRLGSVRRPFQATLMEGRTHRAVATTSYLEQVEHLCAQATIRQESPILAGIRSALADFRDKPCAAPAVTCRV